MFPRSREDFLDPDSGEYATNFDLNSFYYDQRDQGLSLQGLDLLRQLGRNS